MRLDEMTAKQRDMYPDVLPDDDQAYDRPRVKEYPRATVIKFRIVSAIFWSAVALGLLHWYFVTQGGG